MSSREGTCRGICWLSESDATPIWSQKYLFSDHSLSNTFQRLLLKQGFCLDSCLFPSTAASHSPILASTTRDARSTRLNGRLTTTLRHVTSGQHAAALEKFLTANIQQMLSTPWTRHNVPISLPKQIIKEENTSVAANSPPHLDVGGYMQSMKWRKST